MSFIIHRDSSGQCSYGAKAEGDFNCLERKLVSFKRNVLHKSASESKKLAKTTSNRKKMEYTYQEEIIETPQITSRYLDTRYKMTRKNKRPETCCLHCGQTGPCTCCYTYSHSRSTISKGTFLHYKSSENTPTASSLGVNPMKSSKRFPKFVVIPENSRVIPYFIKDDQSQCPGSTRSDLSKGEYGSRNSKLHEKHDCWSKEEDELLQQQHQRMSHNTRRPSPLFVQYNQEAFKVKDSYLNSYTYVTSAAQARQLHRKTAVQRREESSSSSEPRGASGSDGVSSNTSRSLSIPSFIGENDSELSVENVTIVGSTM